MSFQPPLPPVPPCPTLPPPPPPPSATSSKQQVAQTAMSAPHPDYGGYYQNPVAPITMCAMPPYYAYPPPPLPTNIHKTPQQVPVMAAPPPPPGILPEPYYYNAPPPHIVQTPQLPILPNVREPPPQVLPTMAAAAGDPYSSAIRYADYNYLYGTYDYTTNSGYEERWYGSSVPYGTPIANSGSMRSRVRPFNKPHSYDGFDKRPLSVNHRGYDRGNGSTFSNSMYDESAQYTPTEYYKETRANVHANSLQTTPGYRKRERLEREPRHERQKPKPETERDRLLKTWRSHYCETSEDIAKKLAELAELDDDASDVWVRSSPADPFYRRTVTPNEVVATARQEALCKLFDEELIQRAERVKKTLPPYEMPPRKPRRRLCKHKTEECSSSSDDSSEDEFNIEQDCCMEELSRKLQHPYRMHADLWHNDPGEMNDGPLCRCSAKSRRIGIRHGIYPGETGYPKCDPNSNNASRLYHYRITISPPTNFLTKTPTMIKHDQHEFLFEGFSLLTHAPLGDLPTCKVIRFNIEYAILYAEEKMPENFTVKELNLFHKYLFNELLELVDFSLFPDGMSEEDSCPAFHFMPRFVRDLPDNGKEVLAMCEVLKYLLDSAGPLVDREQLRCLSKISQYDWQDYVDFIKGMLVTKPGYKPCSVRVDQLDRDVADIPECFDAEENVKHPAIVHFGIRPPQLSYAGNPEYQKAWREYVKFRHLIANMSKPSFQDKRKLEEKEVRLQEMRTQGRMKRNVTVAVSSKGYYRTGIMCDIVQHAMLIPVLAGHLRFHKSLDLLEKTIDYKFKNRYLLQLALTHPSYKENYGTNPDHGRNSLTNCGIRQPEYGDRKIHYMNTRKRGINTLINIMSRFGKEYETLSNITHNERLEFLGDAVVEFLSSIHLFFMFPDLEEGGLATYRAAIVQNQHLAVLAKKLHLEEYMLYAHGSDLCHELELRHAMANCFEALMGALLLDGGISVADNVFMNALFYQEDELLNVWKNLPSHPLQEQEPLGDRACISSYPILQELTKFEDTIGVEFTHIRLLARAFTDRSIGFTHLTLGSNQRLEFLGDTVLQLICSEYLYRHFPEHHEGHLSLLRSSLVNNRTQAVVCDDLGMTKYAVYSNPKAELKTKDRADLLEAFLGALYVDKGLLYCEQFCHACLFPRLQMFIMNQDWNDPKSKLQQCCLTLRTMDGGEPDIPIYKVIESIGPTNTRVYTVAVYFRSKRLATATGSSIQQAEMNAAKQALENSRDLFPQLDHQKRVIVKSIKKQTGGELKPELEKLLTGQSKRKVVAMEDESHLPKQYREREDISSDELPEDDDESDYDEHNTSESDTSESDTSRQGTSSDEDEETISRLRRKRGRKNKTCSYLNSSKRQRQQISPKREQECRPDSAIQYEICEDVSSDECFDEGDTDTNAAPNQLVKSEPNEVSAIAKSVDLKDLVEDVSSDSEI